MADENHFIWEGDGVTITLPEDGATVAAGLQVEIDRIDALIGRDFTDAGPASLYVSRAVLNAREIANWAKVAGIPGLVPASELHVTIAHSAKPVDWMEMGAPWEETIEIPAGGPRVLEVFGEGNIVLRFASSSLKWRHDEIIRAGASWDHAQYSPHITIGRGELPVGIKPYVGKINLGPEIFEEIKQ